MKNTVNVMRRNPNTPQYWDKIYSSETDADPHMRNDLFSFEIITSYLGTSGTLCDVGCGSGYMLSHIGRERPHLELYGCDISKRGITLAEKRTSATLVTASIYDLPYQDRQFDYTTTTEVLEHLSDIDKAVAELARITKKKSIHLLPYKDYIPSHEHVAEYDQEGITQIFSQHFKHVFTDVYTHPLFIDMLHQRPSRLLLVEAGHEDSH